jgi:hypothetical protein
MAQRKAPDATTAEPAGKAAPGTSVQRWLTTISAYETEFKSWEKRTEKIVKIYRDHDQQSDSRNSGQTNFNILWSNVQTCIPATFARLPKPDVSRRFRDNDPTGRVAALILERALDFEIDHYPDYRAAMENSVLDRFLGGRGISWVRYEPHFKAAEQGMPEDGVQVTEDADEAEETPAAEEVIDYECAPVDYVHWKDFGHTIARTWEEVTAVWRRVYMARPALIERFGEDLGKKIPLDTRPDDQKKSANAENSQACVLEIWDKATNKAYWLSKGMPDMLDERDDPLGLENFFPCPRPLYATTTTDSLVPVPDYKLYQDQATELNTLADRIDGLIKALKVRGVYDAAQPEIARLLTEGENNTLIPVKNWQAFAEKQGLKGAIDILDIAPIAAALNEAYKAVDQVKNQIYEIMGIADILRGASDPGETLGAQKLKGQFGGMRLRAMQGKVGQFATEILQIKAQVMCSLFQSETLAAISGAQQLSDADKQYVGPALAMLKNEPLRNFRIEVSADSMVQMDEGQEKQDRMEFLKATSSFLKDALPVVQENSQIAPLLVEMMKFGVTGFRVGKSIEGQFDSTLDQLKQAAANPQPKAPSKEELKAQADAASLNLKAQLEQQGKQQDMAMEQQRMSMEAHFEQQRQRDEMAVEQHKQQVQAQQIEHQNQLEAQRAQLNADNEQRLEQMRLMHERAMESSRQQLELLITRLTNANRIEVAEVNKSAQVERAQVAGANTAAQDDSIQGLPNGSPTPPAVQEVPQ